LNSKYNWALTALLLLVIFVLALFIFYRWKQNNQNARVQVGGGEPERVYQPQPWSTASSQRDIHLTQMNDPRPYDMPK
jgi:ABC-type Fe3+ transport system permease subunit